MKFLKPVRLYPNLIPTFLVGFALLLLGHGQAHAQLARSTTLSTHAQCSVADFKYRASRFKSKHWTKAKYWGLKPTALAEKLELLRTNPHVRKRGQNLRNHPASRLLRDQLLSNARRTHSSPLKTGSPLAVVAWSFEFIPPLFATSTEPVDRPTPSTAKYLRAILMREHASPALQLI